MYITIYVYYYLYLYYNSKNTGGRGWYRGRERGEGEERRHGVRNGHSPTHVLDRSSSAVLACPTFSPVNCSRLSAALSSRLRTLSTRHLRLPFSLVSSRVTPSRGFVLTCSPYQVLACHPPFSRAVPSRLTSHLTSLQRLV